MNKPKTVNAARPPTTAINQRGTRLFVSAIIRFKIIKYKEKKLYFN